MKALFPIYLSVLLLKQKRKYVLVHAFLILQIKLFQKCVRSNNTIWI